MVSLRRRQVIIGGLASIVAPAVSFAARERLVLSGRIVGPDGKPLPGATVAAGTVSAVTDADGRFMLVTTTRQYRVICDRRAAEGFVSNPRRDADGTWRATFGLTLA
jgi:carboxypeptidase family protein